MTGITDDMRVKMQAINANLSHTRATSSSTWYYRDGEWVKEKPAIRKNHSMFPYTSVQMACEPEDIVSTREYLRKHADDAAKFTEFDEAGQPIITSTKQHDALAKALGMKTGRDGYGHIDEHGNFQNSGRRRADEIAEGRGRVRRAIQELEAMPEEMPAHAVVDSLGEYDIVPNEDNTG